ncbi:MAG TPA: proton-conducting transporter membrane subunit, partial [Rhodocyclaceae bacterium]|nr:proton-conducting transporter membrane subunit [Rhodocyclaceae bacterium]
MNSIMPNLYPASAEIFVLIMACVVLIVDLYCGKKLPGIAFVLTQATLIFAGVIVWFTADAHVALTFSKMFIDDLFGDFMKIAILATMAIAITYGRSYLDDRGLNKGEFYLLALFTALGMMVIVSANHLLVLYIGLELMSLSLYAMVALRREDAGASEGAMKYFLFGALASGFLLYGMSMIYG